MPLSALKARALRVSFGLLVLTVGLSLTSPAFAEEEEGTQAPASGVESAGVEVAVETQSAQGDEAGEPIAPARSEESPSDPESASDAEVESEGSDQGEEGAAAAASAATSAPASGDDDQSGIDPQTRLLLQRPIVTRLTFSHRGLLVVDEDPANNQLGLYQISASGAIFKQLRLFGGALWRQHYSVEPDESALQMGDLQFGFSYPMTLPLSDDLRLVIFHVAAFTLPTSRESRAQDLYVAPRYLASVSLMPLPNLVLSATPSLRYRFHEYAERAGYGGGMNTQLDLAMNFGVDYLIDQTPLFSRYRVGASAGTSYWRRYDSREGYESAASDQGLWSQLYGWEAHLVYTPSFFFSVSLSIEHNSAVRRNGIVNTFFMHRDETEAVLSLSGRY